ncbi:MAG: AAA family ATPase [Marmoricola sp.]
MDLVQTRVINDSGHFRQDNSTGPAALITTLKGRPVGHAGRRADRVSVMLAPAQERSCSPTCRPKDRRGGPMAAGPLVGRDDELAVLSATLDAVRHGRGGLLVVRGEPGIGKTRLLDALQDLSSRQGVGSLRGRATELESDAPFAPVLEALRPGVRASPFEALSSSTASHSPAGRWLLYRAVADMLDELADPNPIALILDDMHWADPVTLEFLEHSIRRPSGRPYLLALALRPGRVADHLLDAGRMTGGSTVVVDLLPLGFAAADELLPPGIGDPDRRRIFVESGGNPMLLTELARTGVGGIVPGGVNAYVQAEIRRLRSEAQRLLRAGAVVGDPFEIDIARRVAMLQADETVTAIDHLVERSLVRSTSQPQEFAFSHPVIRSAVYATLPPGSRLAAHGRAAAVLADIGAPLPARARHVAQSAVPGDIESARVLRAAAALVRPQAPAIAADWLLTARTADPSTDLDGETTLARTLVEAGRLEPALKVIDDALAIDPLVPDSSAALGLVLTAASVERLIGRHDAARRRLETAVRTHDSNGAVAATLLTNLALSAYESGAFDEFAQWAERARAMDGAERLVQGAAAAMLAVGHTFAGRAGPAAAESDLAIDAIETASDRDLATHAELLVAVPWSLIALERLPAALGTAQRIAAAAGRAGNSTATVPLELAVVLALGLLGRIRECVDVADRAEQSARMTCNDQSIQWALWMRAWALLERGQVPTAALVAAESLSLAAGLDDSSLVTVARAVQGAVLITAGEAARGRPLVAGYDLDPGWVCRWAPILVEGDLAVGDLPAAREHAARAREHASNIGLSGPRAAAARALGMVALVDGDLRAAYELAAAAIADGEAAGAELEVARSRILAARRQAGSDRTAAIAHLEAARQQADVGGAQRVHDEAVRELRKLGRRVGRGGPRASGVGDLGSLSPREREIAELVAQGCTNMEMAARLFLSEKTVESHLSRTFAKLDVRSRSALAARWGAGG